MVLSAAPLSPEQEDEGPGVMVTGEQGALAVTRPGPFGGHLGYQTSYGETHTVTRPGPFGGPSGVPDQLWGNSLVGTQGQ